MIAWGDDARIDESLQLMQVDEVARVRIGPAAHRDFEPVVVAVPVRIIAEAERRTIPARASRRIVQAVRGVEMRHPGHHHGARKTADRGRAANGARVGPLQSPV